MSRVSSKEQEVLALFQSAEAVRLGTAYAAGWGQVQRKSYSVYHGKHSVLNGARPVSQRSIFDLASLTKIIATTSLVMVLVESGRLDLDAPLREILPEECKENSALSPITFRHLLSHTSGLPAWRPFFEDLKTSPALGRKALLYKNLLNIKPDANPGEILVYSDLGFLIIGYVLEKWAFPKPLNEWVMEKVWAGLYPGAQPNGLHYRRVPSDYRAAIGADADDSVVATEVCPWRGWLQGQVHDDNTWSIGGIAPHAGVFGTLNDVVGWMEALLQGKIVSHQTLNLFFKEVVFTGGPNQGLGVRRTLGFDMPAADGLGSTGTVFSKNSVGHLGFTGTSLWIDLDTGHYACLLTNRVHPSRSDLRIKYLRRNFHALLR